MQSEPPPGDLSAADSCALDASGAFNLWLPVAGRARAHLWMIDALASWMHMHKDLFYGFMYAG
jgi:hypothetical protein